MKMELLFVYFCLCLLIGSVIADVQVVEPSPCSSSPQNAMDSLDEALAQWAQMSGTVELQLASGEHCIRSFSLVRDLVDREIVGNGSVTIKCAAGLGLAFYNITRLRFTNVVIDGCGLELDYINEFLSIVRADIDLFLDLSNISDQYIAIAVGNCQDFEMDSTSIINTMGLGLLAVNLVGHTHLTNVRFEHNVPLKCFRTIARSQYYELERIGGGALFVYLDYTTSSEISATLEISNSSFHGNSYCGFSSFYNLYTNYFNRKLDRLLGGGGGLSLILPQLQYKVLVTVSNSIFSNNTGFWGGGTFIVFYTGVYDSKVIFQGCEFVSNGVDASVATDYPVKGSALSLLTDFVQPEFQVSNVTQFSPNAVHLVDCSFVNNTALTGVVSLISLYSLILPENNELQFKFTRCTFQKNQAVRGAVIYAYGSIQRGVSLILHDVKAFDNKVLALVSSTETFGVIHLERINFTLTGKSSLQHNSGSALKAIASLIYLQGDISFHNNTATYGGGMNLIENTLVTVEENTSVTFTNNTGAVAGGAIYVNFVPPYLTLNYHDCFLYFRDGFLCSLVGRDYCGDITRMGVTIRFIGNTASLGGMIYGSTLQTCQWGIEFMKRYAPEIPFAKKRLFEVLYEETNFTSLFQFDRLPGDTTAVSTPVLSLTATAVDPMLNSSISHLNVAPGVGRRIELATRDAFGQLVPAVVTSRSFTAGTTSVLGSSYVFVDYNSTQVGSLSVTSTAANPDGDIAEIRLFTLGSFSQIQVNVSFTACPGGFYFNSTYKNCTCLEDLGRFKVTCTPDGGLIVPVNIWVGVNEDSALLVDCSFDFCSRLVTDINVDVDELPFGGQCNEGYNRSGPGCGGCAADYSAAFGSNRCLRCSNTYVLLFLLFAALGILLMAVMLLLRISIAGGFLNGVLFFSNIISLYSTLYAPTLYPATVYSFLLFSWFSLKSGIESCFYDGMRPLHIAVLNFVFPLYLYLLLFIIVIWTRRSTKFAEWLFRTNSSPTKLFATILVMTYSSLLESCVQAISFTTLEVIRPNGAVSEYRWRLDPSHKYFHGAHGALGAFVVVLLVFFIIPAPILGMFPAKIFSIKVFHRYKPIYDAVWAPLKPRYHFWVSFRLFLRVPPLLFVSFVAVPENLLFLSIFLLVILFLHGMVQPFEGMAQNVFDNILQLLLVIITVVSLYFARLQQSDTCENVEALNKEVNKAYDMQRPTIAFLLLLAYGTCCLIFIWHLSTSFPLLRKWIAIAWNRVVVCKKFHVHVPGDTPRPRDSIVIVKPVDTTFSEIRESLLVGSSGEL